jgi:predicted amidophosphoribosyltransferase
VQTRAAVIYRRGPERDIAWLLKSADPEAIARAAPLMADQVLGVVPATLIPVPNSTGCRAANLALAEAIAAITGHPVLDVLRRTRPVESSCLRRREGWPGLKAAEHAFEAVDWPVSGTLILVDNVTTSGATLWACRSVFCCHPQPVIGLVWANAARTSRQGGGGSGRARTGE